MPRLFYTAIVGGLLSGMAILGSLPVLAGDEVDYSAPYLTLEDGKLVTKYPLKEHVPGEDPVRPASGNTKQPPAGASGPPQWPVIAVAAIVAAAALLLLRRRGGKQRDPDEEPTD